MEHRLRIADRTCAVASTTRRTRPARTLWRTRRSAVSLEMAAVALPFLLLLLATFEVSFDLYVQSAMNYAAYRAARAVWSGNVQASVLHGKLDQAVFINDAVCPAAGPMLDCNRIVADVQPVESDFWRHAAKPYSDGLHLTVRDWGVCTGRPGGAVLLQLIYPGPIFVGGFIPGFAVSYGGALVHPTYATMALVNQTGYAQQQVCQG